MNRHAEGEIFAVRLKGGMKMELALKRVVKERETDVQENDYWELISEIREVERKLAYTEDWFALEKDENLIDACIYERESLCARYRYLISLAKRRGVSSYPFRGGM